MLVFFQNFVFVFLDTPRLRRLRNFQGSSDVHGIYMSGSCALVGGNCGRALKCC